MEKVKAESIPIAYNTEKSFREDKTIKLEKVEKSFQNGFFLKKNNHQQFNSFLLYTDDFIITCNQFNAVTHVNRIKRTRSIPPKDIELPNPIYFFDLREEDHPFDIEKFFNKHEEVIKNRRLKRQVEGKYIYLKEILGLLEKMIKTEEKFKEEGEIESYKEIEDDLIVTVKFEQFTPLENSKNGNVNIYDKDNNQLVRGKIIHIEGNNIDVDVYKGGIPSDVKNIIVELDPGFQEWRHVEALKRFLEQNTYANWENLASLLLEPENLEEVSLEHPDYFFCDQDPESFSLNKEQKNAVAGALNTKHGFLIQGPPGTGKTAVISELVQQLVKRDERVLLLAPTHVAIDEVLVRIGEKPCIYPLRLTWDVSRVDESVSKFTEQEITDYICNNLKQPDNSNQVEWKKNIDDIKQDIGELEELSDYLEDSESLEENLLTEKNRLNDLLQSMNDCKQKIDSAESSIKECHKKITKWNKELRKAQSQSGLLNWVKNKIPVLGKIKRLQQKIGKTKRSLGGYKSSKTKNENKIENLNPKIQQLETKIEDLEEEYNSQNSKSDSFAEKINYDGVFDSQEVGRRLEERRNKSEQLNKYIELEELWFDYFSAEVLDKENLKTWIAQSSNVICGTTEGFLGSPYVKNAEFDTVIIDEASKVTDSEFLISAIRSERWILVGDEKQLPPSFNYEYEYFLYALTAIYHSKQNDCSIEDSAEKLAEFWEENEDEEQVQFRKKQVIKKSKELTERGLWKKQYKKAFERLIKKMKRHREKEFLSLIRFFWIESVFKKLVEETPPYLKQRLAEQRRMLPSLAKIVSEPVYKGKYHSPTDISIEPLELDTFDVPAIFIDTSSYGSKAESKWVGTSCINEKEAELTIKLCEILDEELRKNGGKADASILAFYKEQTKLIERKIKDIDFQTLSLKKIAPIDKIQGQEADVIFINFCRAWVRGNPRGGVAKWLQDIRRLNVASTRAHKSVVFVGHFESLKMLRPAPKSERLPYYENLIDLFDSNENFKIIRRLD